MSGGGLKKEAKTESLEHQKRRNEKNFKRIGMGKWENKVARGNETQEANIAECDRKRGRG